MENNLIHFRYGERVTLKIKDPDRDNRLYDFGTQSSTYETVDGRTFTLPSSAVVQLNKLDPRPGDRITILKDSADGHTFWRITAASVAEPVPEEPEPKRREVIEIPQGPAQGRLFDRGTGTYGPRPQPRPQAVPRVPYGHMLRHIIRTVRESLLAEDLRLGDGPTQDLISTVYIDACKRAGVSYDFTEDR